MKSPIYAIKDNLVGFNSPYIRVNDGVAIREFRTMLDKLVKDGDQSVYDLGLYRIGEFDIDKGIICPDDPEVILLATQYLFDAAPSVDGGDIDG